MRILVFISLCTSLYANSQIDSISDYIIPKKPIDTIVHVEHDDFIIKYHPFISPTREEMVQFNRDFSYRILSKKERLKWPKIDKKKHGFFGRFIKIKKKTFDTLFNLVSPVIISITFKSQDGLLACKFEDDLKRNLDGFEIDISKNYISKINDDHILKFNDSLRLSIYCNRIFLSDKRKDCNPFIFDSYKNAKDSAPTTLNFPQLTCINLNSNDTIYSFSVPKTTNLLIQKSMILGLIKSSGLFQFYIIDVYTGVRQFSMHIYPLELILTKKDLLKFKEKYPYDYTILNKDHHIYKKRPKYYIDILHPSINNMSRIIQEYDNEVKTHSDQKLEEYNFGNHLGDFRASTGGTFIWYAADHNAKIIFRGGKPKKLKINLSEKKLNKHWVEIDKPNRVTINLQPKPIKL